MNQFNPVLNIATTLLACDRCNQLADENKALREQLQFKNKELRNQLDVIGMYENEINRLEKMK